MSSSRSPPNIARTRTAVSLRTLSPLHSLHIGRLANESRKLASVLSHCCLIYCHRVKTLKLESLSRALRKRLFRRALPRCLLSLLSFLSLNSFGCSSLSGRPTSLRHWRTHCSGHVHKDARSAPSCQLHSSASRSRHSIAGTIASTS